MNKAILLDLTTKKISEKIQKLEFLIAETRASNNDTKSSMGDKYETSREMLQQEINNLQIQLNENLKAKNSLELIPILPSQKVAFGSLVETSSGLFYVSVSLGNIILDNKKIFLISPESPLAKALLEKREGEEFSLNNLNQKIIKIW